MGDRINIQPFAEGAVREVGAGIKPTYRWREGEVAAWTEGAIVISSRISTKLTTDISALAAG